MNMSVCICTADSNGGYPVPAVRGGAVSTLIEHLVAENNSKQLLDMTIVSLYDKNAETRSKEYPNVHFVWIHVPAIIRFFDKILFFIVLHFFKKRKAISYRTIFSLFFYIVKSAIHLRNTQYDKVILENNIPLAWIVRLSRYKGTVWYHLHNIPRTAAKCKSVFEKCNYLCVSDFVVKSISEKTNAIGPIPKEKCRILYNCVDSKLFNRDMSKATEIRLKYGIKDTERILLFVGRLSEEKGVDKLLGAINKLYRSDVKVLIVGSLIYGIDIEDSYQLKIKEMAEKLGNQVVFTGYIHQSELPMYYNVADITVLPSLWEEPAGLTMIESMSCGTPVITTSQGGIPEYVKDGALIVQVDDDIEENIAKRIEFLLSEESDYENKCNRSMAIVQENFSPEKYLENFYAIIKE